MENMLTSYLNAPKRLDLMFKALLYFAININACTPKQRKFFTLASRSLRRTAKFFFAKLSLCPGLAGYSQGLVLHRYLCIGIGKKTIFFWSYKLKSLKSSTSVK